MPGITEYWEVSWVQYQPNREPVLLGGSYIIVGATGKTVAEFQNVETNQTELMAAAPVGAETWGDAEVATVVTAKLNVPCVFVAPLPPPPAPEPTPEP